jgi:hypothetical protein
MLLSLPGVPTIVAVSPSQVVVGRDGGVGGGFTVTVNDSGPPTLPASSVAMHSTSVLPIGKTEPEGGLQEIAISPPTLSCVRWLFSSNVAVPSTLSSAVYFK